MFYAQFVLAKKGPLSKIWLAAHWEKKLTKAQIFETDVPLAIEEVLQPRVKMALRTVGHLLLGIVRIYSKKTRYLLADTNEAFIKMRLNFRNGIQIEISDAALDQDIDENLENIDELNVTMPEFMNEDLDELALQANLSRFEDITLKDDFNMRPANLKGAIYQRFDGNLIDDFGEYDDMYGSVASSSIHTPAQVEVETARREGESLLNATNVQMNNTVLEASLMDCGEPQATVQGVTDLFQPEAADFDQIMDFSELHSRVEQARELPQSQMFDTMIKERRDDTGPVTEYQEFDGPIDETANDIIGEAPKNTEGSRGSFVLEPLNISHCEGRKGRKNKRTRKLIVDDKTCISNELIKEQMEDYSDLLNAITVAPPTKKMLKMCVSGDLANLMSMPAVPIGNNELLEIYKSRLVPCAYQPDMTFDEASSSSLDRHSQPWDDLELSDHVEDDFNFQIPDSRADSRADDFNVPFHDDFGIPEAGAMNDIPMVEQNNQENIAPGNFDDIGGFGFNRTQDKENEERDDYSDPFSLSSRSSRGKLEAYGFGSAVKNMIYDESKWAKRSQKILKKISNQIEDDGEVTFSSIVSSAKNRKHAAEQFYSLLTLTKSMAVSVQQEEPFGEILISKGANFDEHVGNGKHPSVLEQRTPLRNIVV